MKTKKIISMILAVVMVLTCVPFIGLATIAEAAYTAPQWSATSDAVILSAVAEPTPVIRVAYSYTMPFYASGSADDVVVKATSDGVPFFNGNLTTLAEAGNGTYIEPEVKITFGTTINGHISNLTCHGYTDASCTTESRINFRDVTSSGSTAIWKINLTNSHAQEQTTVYWKIGYVYSGMQYYTYAASSIMPVSNTPGSSFERIRNSINTGGGTYYSRMDFAVRIIGEGVYGNAKQGKTGNIWTGSDWNKYGAFTEGTEKSGVFNFTCSAPNGSAGTGINSDFIYNTSTSAGAGTARGSARRNSKDESGNHEDYNLNYAYDKNRPWITIFKDVNDSFDDINLRYQLMSTGYVEKKGTEAFPSKAYIILSRYQNKGWALSDETASNGNAGETYDSTYVGTSTNIRIDYGSSYSFSNFVPGTTGTSVIAHFHGDGKFIGFSQNSTESYCGEKQFTWHFEVEPADNNQGKPAKVGTSFEFLIYNTDKAALRSLLTTIQQANPQEAAYSSASWSTFKTAYMAAFAELNNGMSTNQSTINSVKNTLQNAYNGLSAKTADVTAEFVLSSDTSVQVPGGPSDGRTESASAALGYAPLAGATVTCTAPAEITNNGVKYTLDNIQTQSCSADTGAKLTFKYVPAVVAYSFDPVDRRAGSAESINLVSGTSYNLATDLATLYRNQSKNFPTLTNYVIEGWYTGYNSSTGAYTGKVTTLTAGTTGSTLYAKWKLAPVTVQYNFAGATAPAGYTSYEADPNTLLTKPADPVIPGYAFDGWYKDSSYVDEFDWTEPVAVGAGTITIYAKLQSFNGNLIFNENGGSDVNDIDISGKTAGEHITLPETTRTGYTFNGWCKRSDLSDTPVPAGDFVLTSDLVGGGAFYAKWTAKTFTAHFNIKYSASSASPIDTTTNPADITCTVGQPMNPAPADPVKYGYVFKGWTMSSQSRYQVFNDEGSYNAAISYRYDTTNCAPTDAAEITLYPMWVKSTSDAFIELETFKMMYGEAVPTDSDDVTIAAGDIIKVRMTPNASFYTGSSEFVYMYDSNFFELVGSGDSAFTLNSESGYIATIGSDYSGYTASPANANCPSGYKWIQIAIDPDVQNGKYLPGAMNDGKWVVEFELRIKSTATGSGIVYMSNDWTRNASNLGGVQFFGRCANATTFVWESTNYDVTPDLTLATSTVTIDGVNTQTTVYANPNGGTWADNTTTNKTFTGDEGEEISGYAAPTKTGYTLSSWVNSQDSTDTWVEGYYGSAAQNGKTYLAQWSPNPYVITWDADGGKFGTGSSASSTATQNVVYDEVLVSYATEPVKAGYKFIGWAEAPYTGSTCYVDAEGVVTVAPAAGTLVNFTSSSPVVTGDKTYYAVWAVAPTTEITFIIHYTNKSTGADATNSTKKASWYAGSTLHIVANDSTAASTVTDYYVKYSELPTITNYHFDDIDARNSNLTAIIGTDASIDVYYYADIKTATFEANGGTYDTTGVTTQATDARGEGYEYVDNDTYVIYAGFNSVLRSGDDAYAPIVPPVTPTRAGFDFVGWATSATATAKGQISQRFNNNYTYYAVWAAEAKTNTFDPNGGSWSGNATPKEVTTNVGATIKIPSPAPGRTGYQFLGWSVNQGATAADTLGTQDTTARTYYAVWQLNNQTYNINVYYMGTDGTYPSAASVSATGSGIGTINADTSAYAEDGFTYDGAAQGTVASITLDASTIGSTQTLKLYYSRNKYDLHFVNSFATSQNVDVEDVYYGADITSLVPTTFTREGYAQDGWVEGTPSTMPAAETTYTADWSIQSYQLSFISEGSDYVAPATVQYGAEVNAPENEPTKLGHTFRYWTLDLTAATPVEATLPTTMPAGNVTYYAYFTVDSHDAKFDPVDGQWSEAPQGVRSISFNYGAAITAPEENPTKYGYTFSGWSPAVEGTMGLADVEYSATYTPKTIAVKFNDNHDSSADYTVNSTFNTAITLPTAPTRTGYQFAGWATSASATTGSTTLGTLTTETPDTYYAVWTANTNNLYTIIVYKQGTDGQYNAADTVLTTKTTGNDGVTAQSKTVTADPIEGFTFDSNASTLTLTIQPDTTGEINVFSLYYTRDKYTFAVDDDGRESSSDVYYGATVTEPVAQGKTGYSFSAWTWEVDGTEATKPATMPAKAIKATAVYTINSYIATFKANGDSWSRTTSADYGTAVSAPDAVPTKTGYTCVGWTVDAESFDESDVVSLGNMPAGGKTFYAVWKANTITNKFWNNDGTDAFQEADSTYNQAIVLPTAPTRTGYTFSGWSTSATATTGSSTLGTQTATAPAEYYAVWTPEVHTYTINIYTQNIGGGDNYTLKESITTREAPVGSTVYYPGSGDSTTLEGFTAPAAVSGTIPASGTLVLDYKYTRDVHTVTYRSSGTNALSLGTFTDAQAHMDTEASTANVRIDTYYYGETIVPATLTRTGYTSSWTGGSLPDVMGTEDLSLTHRWTANNYTATFNANGGVFAEDAVTTKDVAFNSAITADGITAPTKEGYSLNGWSRSASEVVAPGNMDSVDGVTLYAVWAINSYDATFIANGETWDTTSADYNTAITAPEDEPTKTGYTFKGWTVDAESYDESDVLDSLGNMPADGKTFYAVWAIDSHNLVITYTGAGEATPSKYTQSYNYNATYNVASPAVTGYTPDITAVTGTMGTENVAVTVTYTANEYTATFSANGGVFAPGAVSTKQVAFDSAITADGIAVPTRTGYTFKGWAASSSATEPGSLGTMDSINGKTLYAVWSIDSYHLIINYAAAGSTEASQYDEEYEFGASYSVPTPAVTGYTPSQDVVSGTMGVNPEPIYITYTANPYTLTVVYKYADDSTAAQTHTEQVDYDDTYSVASPTITGYTPSIATVEGTMNSTDGITVTVTYTANEYALTINYTGVTVGENPEQYTDLVAFGETYSVASPAVTGYTPDIATVTGTMNSTDGIEVTVTYTADKHTVTLVKPKLLSDGTLSTVDAADATTYDVVFTVTDDYGTAVTGYSTPAIENYAFDAWSELIPETIPATDKFIVASFNRVPVTLAIAAGSTTVIDDVSEPTATFTGYIYGLTTRLSIDDFEENYAQVIGDGHLVVTPVADYEQFGRCGTGTKVELVDNVTDTVVATYYIVIYGDVNGDGNVSSADTSVVKAEVGKVTDWSVDVDPDTTPAPQLLAANLDDSANNVITGEDATCIKELVMKVATVDQATGVFSLNS